jgi:hypothetical protein
MASEIASEALCEIAVPNASSNSCAIAGHRDAELAGRQVLVDVLDLLRDERRAAATLFDQLLQASLRRAHERELGGDEEPVQRDQHGDAE